MGEEILPPPPAGELDWRDPLIVAGDGLPSEDFPAPDPALLALTAKERANYLRGRFLTAWKAKQEGHSFQWPPGDYRDQLPPTMEEVVAEYAEVVKEGHWTFGLLEMWGERGKVAKAAVHIPCWEAFTWSFWKWRGLCFGRTCGECFWTGVDRTRWSRTTVAAGLGREYTWGLSKLPLAQKNYVTRIKALCFLECCITEAASAGFGQFVAPGGCVINFAACYDCHAREKIRRKFSLPPTFLGVLPPGIDDCCTHFLCMYCATHQEARELAVRGIDGPGLHILDVLPGSFKHLPGWKEAVAARADLRAVLAKEMSDFASFEGRIAHDVKKMVAAVKETRRKRRAGSADGSQPSQSVTASTGSATSATPSLPSFEAPPLQQMANLPEEKYCDVVRSDSWPCN